MSVTDLLNEIKGDADSAQTDPIVTSDDSITVSPALESLQSKTGDIVKNLDLQKLAQDVIQTERVSKELALEVFAMLPPMVNVSNYLTNAPSVYNKSLVIDKMRPYDKKEEIREFLNSLIREVLNVVEDASKIKNLTEAFMTVAKPDFDRLDKCPPIVIHPGGKFNLLGDNIERIVEVSDTLYRYEPYENRLRDMYTAIVYNSGYSLLKKQMGTEDGLSLAQIYQYFSHIADHYSRINEYINSTVDRLNKYDSQTGTKYIVEDAFNMIKTLPVDNAFFNGKESIAEKLIELLKFLK